MKAERGIEMETIYKTKREELLTNGKVVLWKRGTRGLVSIPMAGAVTYLEEMGMEALAQAVLDYNRDRVNKRLFGIKE